MVLPCSATTSRASPSCRSLIPRAIARSAAPRSTPLLRAQPFWASRAPWRALSACSGSASGTATTIDSSAGLTTGRSSSAVTHEPSMYMAGSRPIMLKTSTFLLLIVCGSRGWDAAPRSPSRSHPLRRVDPEVVEHARRGGGARVVPVLAVRDQADPGRFARRQGPGAAPDKVFSVAAGRGPELVLAVGRIDAVGKPEPGGAGRWTHEHAAVGAPAGVGHLLAELRLAGVPDRDVREPDELVVAQVGDEPALLVVADVLHPEVYRQLRLGNVSPLRRVAQ